MRGFGIISVFALFALPLSSLGAVVDPPTLKLDVESATELARKLDPLGDKKWRPLMEGSHRMRSGLQIHPSCWSVAEKGTKDQAAILANFDRWVSAAIELAADRCWNRYPELRVFLGEWISQVRRAVVVCDPREETARKYGGLNYQYAASFKDFPKDQIENLKLKGDGALPDTYQSVFVFPSDRISTEVMRDSSAPVAYYAVETLIHEGLHSTRASIRQDVHWERETALFDIENSCKLSAADDAVSTLSSLCSGLNLNSAKILAEEALARRAEACPHLCVNQFEELAKALAANSPGEATALRAQINPLCRKIEEFGKCPMRIVDLSPAFSALQDKLYKRLTTYVPFSDRSISDAFIASEPELQALLKRVSGCRWIERRTAPQPGYFFPRARATGYGQEFANRLEWMEEAVRSLDQTFYECGVYGAELEGVRKKLHAIADRMDSPLGSLPLQLIFTQIQSAESFSDIFKRAVTQKGLALFRDLGTLERTLGEPLVREMQEMAVKVIAKSQEPKCL